MDEGRRSDTMKTIKLILLFMAIVCVLILIAASLLPKEDIKKIKNVEHPFGMSPMYPVKDYDPKLTSFALNVIPIMKAAEDYKTEKKAFAKSLEELRPYLEKQNLKSEYMDSLFKYRGYSYFSKDTYYCISIRLGQDPSLEYTSNDKTWRFCPGDGSQDKEVKLKINPN